MLREVGDLERFAETAKPGARVTYGRGERPPAELVRAMQPFIASGALAPMRKREGTGFLFMVERGRGDLPARRKVRRRTVKTALSRVFDCLSRAAARGEPCPTNDELAEWCALSGKLQASYRVRQLVKMGWITVEDRSPFGRRIVTVLHGPRKGTVTREASI